MKVHSHYNKSTLSHNSFLYESSEYVKGKGKDRPGIGYENPEEE
jgi:hypothetical protein